MKTKYIVGIDEAGRGPLAGPVSVGLFLISESEKKFLKKYFKNLKDSKKLSEKTREDFFEKIKKLKKEGKIDFSVSLVSESIIDTKGISHAIHKGIKDCLKKIKIIPEDTKLFLDGGLKAPAEFLYQETIIKGDEKVAVISLASIVAKVSRDVYMKKISKKYTNYNFAIHKGYGTKKHIEEIKNHGLSLIHRKSFTKKFHEV